MSRELVTKTVICNGNPTEVLMRQMLKPCSKEEFDAMTPEEREDYKCPHPAEQSRL